MNPMKHATACSMAVLALAACSKKPPESLPPAPSAVSQASSPAPQTSGVMPGSQAEFRATMSGRDTIYFDTDQYNIDGEDTASLRTQAEWLARYPQKRAVVEGHADERGTRDYNLALGERRANSARNYLVSLGIADSRLTVVSYGEERPANSGADAAAWAQNRRAVTVTID